MRVADGIYLECVELVVKAQQQASAKTTTSKTTVDIFELTRTTAYYLVFVDSENIQQNTVQHWRFFGIRMYVILNNLETLHSSSGLCLLILAFSKNTEAKLINTIKYAPETDNYKHGLQQR